MSEQEFEALVRRRTLLVSPIPSPAPKDDLQPQSEPESQKQTKTEMEYGRMLGYEFPGSKILPWGITLRMENGHKYTPDYLVMLPDKYLLVEVKQRGKDGFRQNSYQRAKVAFDQCRVEFKLFRYRWAEKHCGMWAISDFSS